MGSELNCRATTRIWSQRIERIWRMSWQKLRTSWSWRKRIERIMRCVNKEIDGNRMKMFMWILRSLRRIGYCRKIDLLVWRRIGSWNLWGFEEWIENKLRWVRKGSWWCENLENEDGLVDLDMFKHELVATMSWIKLRCWKKRYYSEKNWEKS